MKNKLFRIKLFGLTFLIWLIGYLVLNQLSAFRIAAEPKTFADSYIPFFPEAILVYLSVYFLVILPIFLIKDDKIFQAADKAIFFVIGISFLFYLLIPTFIERPQIVEDNSLSQLWNLQMAIDKPYNLLPSLHVAFSFIVAFILYHENKKYWWTILWAALIAISTLFVKQHYFLDVFTGVILAFIAYMVVFLEEIKSNTGKAFKRR